MLSALSRLAKGNKAGIDNLLVMVLKVFLSCSLIIIHYYERLWGVTSEFLYPDTKVLVVGTSPLTTCLVCTYSISLVNGTL